MLKLTHTGILTLILLGLVNVNYANPSEFSGLSGNILSQVIPDNSALLQLMIIVLVVLVFGYAAKLFYEHTFRKE